MSYEKTEGSMIIPLSGSIDSNHSAATEQEIRMRLKDYRGPLVFDAEKLEYISSSGLRVILHIKKDYKDLRIINVHPEIYDIFEMTGFTQMMKIEKAFRVVSVEGAEVIGQGANGTIYRIDEDNVVKVYKNADALEDIQHEREVARLALILGVPTAIAYDVVRVGNSYGSVFELLDARSFAKIIVEEPQKLDWCIEQSVDLLKKIHSIEVPEGKLPSVKETNLKRIRRMMSRLPDTLGQKLLHMVEEVPESNHMIHGDFHTKNIVLSNNEVLLIDMDTLSVGDPYFELVQMYKSYIGFSAYDPMQVLKFQGYDINTANTIFDRSLKAYFNTEDETFLNSVKDKIRCVAYATLIDRLCKRSKLETKEEQETVALWQEGLVKAINSVDSLEISLDSISCS